MDKQNFLYVLSWLNGYHGEDGHGLSKIRYLSLQQDNEARRLLADALRNRDFHHQQLLDNLADLIDPSDGPENRAPRILVFKFRKRGNRRNNHRSSEIYFHVSDLVNSGEKVEPAIALTMERFKLSRSEVYDAWVRHKWEREIVWPRPPDGIA